MLEMIKEREGIGINQKESEKNKLYGPKNDHKDIIQITIEILKLRIFLKVSSKKNSTKKIPTYISIKKYK